MESSNNLYNGVAMPYLSIFDQGGMPVNNPLTGIPLGVYISNFSYKYDEEKENQASLTLDTGDPDTVDISELQEGRTLLLQWGYIYPDGSHKSSPVKPIKVKDLNCKFDSSGTHVTILCIDGISNLRHSPPHSPSSAEDDNDGVSSMVDFMNRGCDRNIGIIIEEFK